LPADISRLRIAARRQPGFAVVAVKSGGREDGGAHQRLSLRGLALTGHARFGVETQRQTRHRLRADAERDILLRGHLKSGDEPPVQFGPGRLFRRERVTQHSSCLAGSVSRKRGSD
jgi:hypothetical protein